MVRAWMKKSGLNFWKIPCGEWNSIVRKFVCYLQFSNIRFLEFPFHLISSWNFWSNKSRFGNSTS